jgi:hypothetical protein
VSADAVSAETVSAEAGLLEATSRLRPVTLDEVLEYAALQTRVDRKYLVPAPVLTTVLDRLGDHLAVLQIDDLRLFRYESVYFDTPQLATYRQHAHGRRRRAKIRTRTYLDSGECLLEFKSVGSRGETVKERYPYRLDARDHLDVEAHALAVERLGAVTGAPTLAPTLTTAYRRATLVDPTRGDRVTCDVNLTFENPGGQRYGPLEAVVVLESKTMGAASPLDHALCRLGYRPVSLSKYCVGMAVLDPALPANRWNRELRTHFGWVPEPRSPN